MNMYKHKYREHSDAARVVICLSRRLSHACLSISTCTVTIEAANL